jgi:hypothetical protein
MRSRNPAASRDYCRPCGPRERLNACPAAGPKFFWPCTATAMKRASPGPLNQPWPRPRASTSGPSVDSFAGLKSLSASRLKKAAIRATTCRSTPTSSFGLKPCREGENDVQSGQPNTPEELEAVLTQKSPEHVKTGHGCPIKGLQLGQMRPLIRTAQHPQSIKTKKKRREVFRFFPPNRRTGFQQNFKARKKTKEK